ncbi:hypothetical protein D3C87_1896320 [compost metagenome]
MALTSLGKHEPPQPMPARKKAWPMRWSKPMPSATFSTSAPTRSQMLAISLMKEILVAKKQLAAYLIISALLRSVTMKGIGRSGFPPSKLCSISGV